MIETKLKEPKTEFVMSVEVCLDGETWNRVYVHKKYREIVKWDGDLDHARRYKKFDDAFSSFRKMAKPECWYRNFQIHEIKPSAKCNIPISSKESARPTRWLPATPSNK